MGAAINQQPSPCVFGAANATIRQDLSIAGEPYDVMDYHLRHLQTRGLDTTDPAPHRWRNIRGVNRRQSRKRRGKNPACLLHDGLRAGLQCGGASS